MVWPLGGSDCCTCDRLTTCSVGTHVNYNASVEFIHVDHRRVAAKDIETGVASFGHDRAETLRMPAGELDVYHRKGEP
ncbi:hypothetical protein GJR98_15675 [Haloferax sp. MBLA0077]|uniref:Uncharacterized protein n=2 Tax=Haloferax TaxID=2251 RepID=A0A6G1Z6M4_9EURY|nr:hypothetical protein Hfx1149_15710 [Haloferax sp. CBA1149]MRW82143.1 hypothetical protein [Haloferax marinisediminis]